MDSVLNKGLRCGSSGSKSNDVTQKVDAFLDLYVPESLKKAGVSRSTCIYGYLGNTEMIIDIKNGAWKPVSTFTAKPKTVLLKLTVDKKKCFVSNLNSYDELKAAIQEGANLSPSQAHSYWENLIPFSNFVERSDIRPEVMIPHSIPPKDIEVIAT